MYRVNERARRERTTSTLLDLRVLFATVIVSVLAVVGTTAGASAQVGNTDRFTPQSWQAGEGEARRSRSPRRAVTTTSNLEDFDVPATSVRRSAKSSSARASRIVERSRPNQRRVRVAALSRSDAQSVAAPARSAQRATPRRTRVASLGRIGLPSVSAPRPSLSGGGIAWRASSGCLAGNLRSIVASVAANYGPLTVNSTCRSRTHNRRVGGASKSWHLTGNAVDFRVRTASIGGLTSYLRGNVGGFKHYGGGRYHIDNGPKRSF